MLSEHQEWTDFYPERIQKVKSDFWLAYAIIQPEYSSLRVRYNYYRLFPDFLSRTINAVAAILNQDVLNEVREKGVDFDELLSNKINHFDPELHEKIRQSIEEKKWIIFSGATRI